jgi:GT2 family glycosyltransferase
MVRLDAAAQLGPLDEGFFMYWEDTEWSCRAIRSRWGLMIDPRAHVWHRVSQSSEPAERIEMMIRNRIRFVRMTASRPRQAIFMTYMLSGWLPAYLVFRLAPRLGVRAGLGLIGRAVRWNLEDARRHGWDLRSAVSATGR